jgi:hypothetical protein
VSVLQPFGDNGRYGFVVGVGDVFHGIQVKTGRIENGRIPFETGSSGTLTGAIEEGRDGQIDVFAVYSPPLDEPYVVPISDAPSASTALRIDEPENRSPNSNWAEEFGIDCWLSSIE